MNTQGSNVSLQLLTCQAQISRFSDDLRRFCIATFCVAACLLYIFKDLEMYKEFLCNAFGFVRNSDNEGFYSNYHQIQAKIDCQ